MNGEHLTDLRHRQADRIPIFRVDKEFIADLRAARIKHFRTRQAGGFPDSRCDSPDGPHAAARRAILRRGQAHCHENPRATPEWVEELKKHGYDTWMLEKLIAFRIHGVVP